MIKICFVCVGNTCRSVMAERLLRKKLKKEKINDVKIISRGVRATGENITKEAKNVLKTMSAASGNRKSIKLGKIDQDMLYIVMTENLKGFVASKKVISIKDLVGEDLLDPYGQGEHVYFETANQIIKANDVLIEKIKMWRRV